MTLVTSTWSSGHASPLGICKPDNFLQQKAIDEWNQQYVGECYIFRSNSTSHFMSGESFLTLLHGLVTPALKKQRERLGVPTTIRALLLCDAWTGFHSYKSGLDSARSAWSQQNFCDLPSQQVWTWAS